MDGHQFDRLARELAQHTSRRRLLGGLLGGAFGGALGAVGLREAAAACPHPMVDCPRVGSGNCVNLRTDPANCGRCGNACATELCYAARCRSDCPNGFDACGGTCLRACAAGQVRLADCTCCTLTTCAGAGADCGELADGCGGTLDCGGCTEPDTCGGGGVENVCGCTPKTTCEPEECGELADGCGGILDCGACVDPCVATLQAGGCTFDELNDIWVCGGHTNLEEADLADCDLSGANLASTPLSDANLSDATLTDANLSNANLGGANLNGAILSGANLSNATLISATLRGATLQSATLIGVNVALADLTDADLTDANLHQAIMTFVTWANTTCPTGENSDAHGFTCCAQLLPGHVPTACF